jgi:hypothetical protein
VHDDALEIDAATADAQLNGVELPVVVPYVDIVVILSPVHMGITEIVPAPLLGVQ